MRRLIHFGSLPAAGMLLLLLFVSACQQQTEEEPLPPLVQPPIPAADPAFTTFSFHAEEGLQYAHPSGTTFEIPANSLLDAAGMPIQGSVEGRFREFHDATGIFLAGIPMEYNGGNFTTAGSFELRVEQNGLPVFLDATSSVNVRQASFETEDDYQFYFLNEDGRAWDSLGTASPEINEERVALQEKIDRMQPSLAFPLNRKYLAFNYNAILDVYYKDDFSNMDKELVEKKMKAYGLGWTKSYTYQEIDFKGQQIPAEFIVWKNLDGKAFPKWTEYKRGFLTKIRGNTYQCKFVSRDTTEAPFEVRLRAVMSLNELFAFPPEQWKNNYEATLAKIEEERQRMQTMAEVYRSFEIREFGIYNWDKLLKEEDRVILAADFDIPVELNENLTQLTMVLITGDGKGIIKYPDYTWNEMALIEDPGAKFFTVLPGNKIAVYPPADFRNIDFEALRTSVSPAHLFDMKVLEPEIASEEMFREMF